MTADSQTISASRFAAAAKPGSLLAVPLGLLFVLGAWQLLALQSMRSGVPQAMLFASAFLAAMLAAHALRDRFEIDAEGMTRTTLFGATRFERRDFLSYEILAEENGKAGGVLFRFRSGVLYVDSANLKLAPEQAIEYLNREWRVEAREWKPETLGPVDPVQQFVYDRLHGHLLLASAFILFALTLPTAVAAGGALIAFVMMLPAWRMMGTLETDEKGITWNRWLRPAMRFRWVDIQQVGYWNSFLQGGLVVRSGKKRIRIYRSLLNYPRFNRLLHDQVAANRFAPQLAIPMRIGMNRRQRIVIVVAYLVMLMTGIPWIAVGLAPVFGVMAAVGTAVAVLLVFGSGRVIEIDSGEVRDTQWALVYKRSTHYARKDLIDARLGRDLTSGGLWMRFRNPGNGQESVKKLEITNMDANTPVEQVLDCLRREWGSGQKHREG